MGHRRRNRRRGARPAARRSRLHDRPHDPPQARGKGSRPTHRRTQRAPLRAAPTSEVIVGRATSLGAVSGGPRATFEAVSLAAVRLRIAAAGLDREVAVVWAALTVLLLGRLVFAAGTLWRERRTWIAREI